MERVTQFRPGRPFSNTKQGLLFRPPPQLLLYMLRDMQQLTGGVTLVRDELSRFSRRGLGGKDGLKGRFIFDLAVDALETGTG